MIFKAEDVHNLFSRAVSLIYYAYHYFLEWCAMNW
jgi:hypothetical protein